MLVKPGAKKCCQYEKCNAKDIKLKGLVPRYVTPPSLKGGSKLRTWYPVEAHLQ